MEATVAVNFLLSYLYNKLPRRRVDMFGEMLEQLLQTNLEKFWLNQLNKTDPTFGVSVNPYVYSFHVGIGPNQIDSLINQVSAACLIDIYEILSYFPENLTLFIEPGKLQYCLNLSDSRIDIWRSDQRKYEVFELLKEGLLQQSPGFEPQQQQQQSQQPPPQQPIPESELIPSPEKLPLGITGNLPYSSTFGWQGPSATSQIVQVSSEGCFIQKSSSTPNFTAASFAQTKFGSTKLKSQLKRSSRISTYLAQQRSLAAVISPTGSGLAVGAGVTTISTTTTATTLVESIIKSSKTTSTGSPLSLSPFASSYFDSPTAMMSQRSISLSPCVKPQRGHSPPYSFNLPLILPPFTSSGPEIIGAPQFPISSTTQVMAPTIQITREDATPITFAITTIDEQFSWHKKSDF